MKGNGKRLKASVALSVSVAMLLAACSAKEENGAATGTGGEGAPSNAISDKVREVKVTFPEHPNQAVKSMAPVQEEILKRTNIKLKFETVPTSNYKDKKKTLLATNNLPDIIQIDMSDVNSFASVGVFLPVLSYVNEGKMPNFKKFWEQYPDLVKLTANGELYGFPAIGRNELANGFGPVIRTDLLEKHNLAVPATYDELLDVLKKLKELYPGSIPWSVRAGSGPVHQLFKTMTYTLGSGIGNTYNGVYYDKDVGGGRYVYGPGTSEFKEVLRFFNKAYAAGVLDRDYAVSTSQQWTEKLTSGKAFFFFDNSGFALDYTRQLQQVVPEGKFQLIPMPKNSKGTARAEYYATTISDKMFAISAKSKDPDTLIRLIDWMYSEEASNLMNYGVEGVHHTVDASGKPQFKPEFVSQFKDGQPTPFYALYSALGTGKLTFTPWFANMEPQIQIEKLTGNWTPEHETYWKTSTEDAAYHEPYLDPPFTTEESAKIKDIVAPLQTMLEQEFDKFIMGVKPIDEYDQVMKKANEMGGKELERIYNEALNRLK